MNNDKHLFRAAKRIAFYFLKKVCVESDSEQTYRKNRLKGLHLPSIFFFKQEKQDSVKKLLSDSYYSAHPNQSSAVITHTTECCAKQDFYLFPYRQIFAQGELSFKEIIGWKTCHNMRLVRNIQHFAAKLKENHPEFYQRFVIFQLHIEQDLDKTYRAEHEEWEQLRCKKDHTQNPNSTISD